MVLLGQHSHGSMCTTSTKKTAMRHAVLITRIIWPPCLASTLNKVLPIFLTLLLTCHPAPAAEVNITAEQLSFQSNLASGAKQYEKARDLAEQALMLAERDPNFSPVKLARILIQLADVNQKLSQLDLAQKYCRRAVDVVATSPSADLRFRAFSLTRLAEILSLAGDPVQAETWAAQALEVVGRAFGPEAQELIGPLGELGAAYLAQDKTAQASQVLERALRISQSAPNIVGTYYQNLFIYAARLYRKTGQQEKAAEMETRAKATATTIFAITNVRPEVTKPVALPNTCRPAYPREAIRYELEGETYVQLDIDASGAPTNARILRSSGWTLLDRATLDGFSLCRFRPAMKGEQAVPAQVTESFRWRLDAETPGVMPTLVNGSCATSSEFSIVSDSSPSSMRLRFLLDTEGKPIRVVVDTSSATPDVNARAIQFIESCRYQPARAQDKSVIDTTNVRLRWNG